MSSKAYRLLGFAVWRGGKWYVRRRYRGRLRGLASRRAGLAAAGVASVGLAGAAIALSRRSSD